MYHVKADTDRNRLYISFSGVVTADEVKKIGLELTRELDKLRTGFNVISDISALDVRSQIGAKDLIRLQKTLMTSGVDRLIRVAGDQFISLHFFESISREAGMIVECVNSIKEAETLLESNVH